jgi:hypothetical protein
MRPWLFIGLALLALSGLVAAISLILAVIASETPLTHDQYLSTVHASHIAWYTALGIQLIAAWVTWRGFSRPKHHRLRRFALVVAGYDIGSFVIALVLLDSHWAWVSSLA